MQHPEIWDYVRRTHSESRLELSINNLGFGERDFLGDVAFVDQIASKMLVEDILILVIIRCWMILQQHFVIHYLVT